jgi:Protein of unknown function (DUF3800)
MPKVVNFYMDDSGTRHPDHKPGKKAQHGYDWFALGGVLVKEEDEPAARKEHKDFCAKWNITYPIHSVEIRGKNLNFNWLEKENPERQAEFFEELYQMMKNAPVIGLACVIDRPGYNARYREKYGHQRWALCKSAFSISVERAAKYARDIGYKLRVAPERCNREEDATLKGYYADIKANGLPFAKNTSEKYLPITPEQFAETLYEFKPKAKTSPMAQFADLYLWPMCMGGYHTSNRPYQRLKGDHKLIECHLAPDDHDMRATKYYCFDSVVRKP